MEHTFHFNNTMARTGIYMALRSLIRHQNVPPVILCIGSDLAVGDSLGPIVGTMLSTGGRFRGYVYGTLRNPVTAKEAKYLAEFLKKTHPHGDIVAVDAAVRRYRTPCVAVRLEMDYSLYGRVANLLPRHGAVVRDSDFGAAVRLEAVVEAGRYPAFARELEELTSAAVYPQVLGEVYWDMKPREG